LKTHHQFATNRPQECQQMKRNFAPNFIPELSFKKQGSQKENHPAVIKKRFPQRKKEKLSYQPLQPNQLFPKLSKQKQFPKRVLKPEENSIKSS